MATTQIRGSTQILSASILDAQISASAAIATSKLADGALFLKKDGSVALTASLPAGGFSITNLGTPSASTDAATKGYVDAAAVGYDIKPSVRAATTANITLSNTQTIDGVALSAGNRVLVKDQTTGSENGIYVVVSGGAWTRATDADTSAEVTSGMYTYVSEGTVNGTNGWVLITVDPITLGSTALVFTQTSGAGQITAGTGLSKTANTLSIDSTVATLTGTQTLTNKSIVATQLTGTLAAAQFPVLTGDVTTAGGALATTIAAAAVTLAKMASLAANSVIGNSTGSSATPTAVSMVTAATASTVPIRDANANVRHNNVIKNLATTATAAGTTTLTVSSSYSQQFTGSTTQTVVLPDATTLTIGHPFFIANRSSAAVTVNANGGSLVQTMAAGSQLQVTAVTIGTTAGTWDAAYSVTNAGGGTVTSITVASSNGFTGSSSGGATPALTLATSVTGILKGNGTAISAATVGSDYVNNASFVIREVPTGTVNGSNAVFTTANTVTSGTECVYLNGLLQSGGGDDYTFSSTNTITFVTAPATGDRILVNYHK